ncbi:MAG: DUF349 domain-containing protein [Bacteroidales bacterium]|nr:DUF349 domain-containing protein [Bacteroidales bacterium]
MEDLNEMQTPAQNEELQPVVEQAAPAAADNDSDTIKTNPAAETVVETAPQVEATVPDEAGAVEPTAAPAEEPARETSAVPNEVSAAPAPAEPETEAETEEEPQVDYTSMSREELLAAFNELMNEDINKIRNRATTIRNQFNLLNKEMEKQAFEAFLADGGNKDDYHPANDALAETFYKAYDNYRARRQKMQEELETQKQRNLEAKQQILEELRTLIDKDEETLKQTYDEFNAIQEKWKGIGEVPREQMNDLWQNYHFLIEQFFNKVKINKELRMLDLKRNLEQKIQLCERAEELIVDTSVLNAFKTLQSLRAQWKEIGPVPAEQNEETWQRFNNAANQIDERRREYYDQRKEELEQNLLAKQALITKAQELTQEPPRSSNQWNTTTEALDELLKLWKSIGPVPREQNETVWGEFKSILDKFFQEKKEHFEQQRMQHNENYNKKVDLCLRAEAIAKREDWKKATEEILQLQEEWKTIGPVSAKQSERVWKRFRGACDQFFAKKGEYFKEIRSSEGENLTKKNAIISELSAFQFGDDKEENLKAIKDFQRRWSEIGHVPRKDKDKVTTEYRQLLDGIFEKLRISAREAKLDSYREKVRNHEGDNYADSERSRLMNKIEKLRADLNLWENNIGFFANSKQADLLKEEFEKKMQGTRQEIALLEAKIRVLDESESDKADKSDNKEE